MEKTKNFSRGMESFLEIGFSSLIRLIEIILEFLVNYSFQVVGAIITLFFGLIIAKWASKFVLRLCEKKGIDITLKKFLTDLVKILIIIFVVIICLGKFGISVAPFIATLGAVTLGISLALQGLLSNYAAGLLIIFTRPFIVGNTISVKNNSGVVEKIKLVATILSTEDGEQITIPNKHIIGEIFYNSFAYKVVESSVLISYEDDPIKAINLIQKIIESYAEIAKEPPPLIGIEEFADSGISLGLRYWVPTKKFFQIQYDVNLAIFRTFEEHNISIPFPQRDIHLISRTNEKSQNEL